MNWKLLVAVPVVGFLFAMLTVFAVIQGIEHWIALVFLIGVGIAAGLLECYEPLKYGFFGGFLTALTALWTQAAFMPLYLANNPIYASGDLPFSLSERSFTFLFSPIGASIGGLIAMIVAKPFALVARRYL